MKKQDYQQNIPPEYQKQKPDGTGLTLGNFAESVTKETLPYFLFRIACETDPKKDSRKLLLLEAAEHLQISIDQINSLLFEKESEMGLKISMDPLEVIKHAIISEGTFRNISIPERPFIMVPWLKTAMLVLISAGRGVGKTWFVLCLLVAITRALSIGKWKTETPVPCLYVDGEMAADDLQSRLKGLTKGLPEPIKQLDILSAELMHRKGWPSPNVATPEWRNALYQFLKESPYKVVALDNIASLSPGLDENNKMDWDPINQWLLSLRFIGITIIMVHHLGKGAGKRASQRGTSSREDAIDVSIILSLPGGKKVDTGCQFNIEFTKSRGVHGNGIAPFCFSIISQNDGLSWKTDDKKNAYKDDVIVLLGHKIEQKEISGMLNMDKAVVSRIKTAATKDGIIEKVNRGVSQFTQKGRDLYGHIDLDSILN